MNDVNQPWEERHAVAIVGVITAFALGIVGGAIFINHDNCIEKLEEQEKIEIVCFVKNNQSDTWEVYGVPHGLTGTFYSIDSPDVTTYCYNIDDWKEKT